MKAVLGESYRRGSNGTSRWKCVKVAENFVTLVSVSEYKGDEVWMGVETVYAAQGNLPSLWKPWGTVDQEVLEKWVGIWKNKNTGRLRMGPNTYSSLESARHSNPFGYDSYRKWEFVRAVPVTYDPKTDINNPKSKKAV